MELQNICQKDNGNALDFLFRALGLRQKIMSAAEDDESLPSQQLDFIQILFLRALETGMGDETVLTRIQPFLEKAIVDDDQILIHQVQTALSTNLERTSIHKFG